MNKDLDTQKNRTFLASLVTDTIFIRTPVIWGGGQRQMSRNGKSAGVELAIFLMIQIQQNYTLLYSL